MQNGRLLEQERSESARLRELLEKLRLELSNVRKEAEKSSKEVNFYFC